MDEEGEGYVDLEVCDADLTAGKWRRVVTSRKVWMAVIGVVMAAIVFAKGGITAEQLVEVILGLVAAVIVATGIEDAGQRASGR